MKNLPVHWSEGMFLRPQHFQAAERYWAEALDTSEHWDHAYNYGLRSIELSKEAIANQKFQLTSCEARLRDGTLVALRPGQEPDRIDLQGVIGRERSASVDLTTAFQQGAQVRVLLAVPKLRLGRPNVGASDADLERRYVRTPLSLPDESRGGRDQDIEHRALNVQVLLETQPAAGYETLPIAQIRRTGDEKAAPQLDDEYIPPLLAIDAWPPLSQDIVRVIYDLVGQKITSLSEQVLNRGMTLASDQPGDLERIHMLTVLNGAAGVLNCLTFAAGVHPFTAYAELCRLVGQLAIFGPTRRAPDFPNYDHDNLAYIFKWVKQQIIDLLNAVRDYEYEQRFFIGAGRGMQVTLEPKWLNPGWNWFVGVNRGNATEQDCRELLSAGNLDWKLGSSQQVDILFRNRAPGLQLVPLPQAPRALPSAGGWLYYEVTRGNAAWKDVQATQTLAMRFKEELISNLDTLSGQRDLVVNARGKQVVLQVALFAVPTQQK